MSVLVCPSQNQVHCLKTLSVCLRILRVSNLHLNLEKHK